MSKKTVQILIGVLAGIAFLGIVLNEFLFNRDCDTCVTGMEVLKAEGSSFWISNLILSALGVAALWGFLKLYKSQLDFGAVRKLLVAALLFFGLSWIKDCVDKADGSLVTTEKGRNLPKVDDGRQAAEEMLKK